MKEILWSQALKATSAQRIFNALTVLASFGLSSITKKSYIWGAPFVVTVEPTVLCNLRCPQCITGMGRINRKQSSLSLNQFRIIIKQLGSKIWYLLLFNQGEPFLNPNLIKFIQIAKQKRIYVTTSTNGHFLIDKDFVQQLVVSGLDAIIISLDGVDAETYSKYRTGGNFQQVIHGIKNLIEIKNKLHMNTPRVLAQCLVMKHNEHQLDQMKTLATELKVDQWLFKTFQIESRHDGLQFLPDNPGWRRYIWEGNKIQLKNHSKNQCFRLWFSTVILSDGRIIPCCFDKNGEFNFGNIDQKIKIAQIWKSDAYNEFRVKVLQRPQSMGICQNCTQNQKVYI